MSFEIVFHITILAIFIFSIDDLLIDLLSLLLKAKPKALGAFELSRIRQKPESRIAIIIANWKESDILRRMIVGNLSRIDYSNYEIFLGVYPNDVETKNEALKLAEDFHQVRVVVNTLHGPTSKGQMLNEVIRYILKTEVTQGYQFDALLMQDSEDIIHSLSLKMINHDLESYDFIQTPVLCLPQMKLFSTRGTYVDEFTDSHLKELILRSQLKAGVPSAGVGTAISRLLMSEFLEKQNGHLFNQETLTEDYHLGLSAHRWGYPSVFSCYYFEKNKTKEFIATQELFPDQIKQSVRQKTRWTMGIAIQGFANLGWVWNVMKLKQTVLQNYFLWRDRRSLVNAPFTVLSFLLLGLLVFNQKLQIPEADIHLMAVSLGCLLFRSIYRSYNVYQAYGLKIALGVMPRWFLSTLINTIAGFKAMEQAITTYLTKTAPKWDKTTHELPENFGYEENNPRVLVQSELNKTPYVKESQV